ncbi:Uncharacterized protein FWK35_00019530 [Aphis craccivora]|uniref:Uncharacterized protein n=1 Tax=Aphis craccivora TaxID=307492 RepID=A0A6G0YN93_APHCR|nr:Uncharacterized protein FWK35_00019530 [Aphis craccivora]
MASILMSGSVMNTHENWCRSVIDSLDLEVNHIKLAFGLPPPTNVLWMYHTLQKLHSSFNTPMVQRGCPENQEACEDSLKKSHGFWRRTKKRLSNIFRAVCCNGCAIDNKEFLIRCRFYFNRRMIQ